MPRTVTRDTSDKTFGISILHVRGFSSVAKCSSMSFILESRSSNLEEGMMKQRTLCS